VIEMVPSLSVWQQTFADGSSLSCITSSFALKAVSSMFAQDAYLPGSTWDPVLPLSCARRRGLFPVVKSTILFTCSHQNDGMCSMPLHVYVFTATSFHVIDAPSKAGAKCSSQKEL
jgi:hypothetical protein